MQNRTAVTLVEMLMAMMVSSILFLTMGFLVSDSEGAWGSLQQRSLSGMTEEANFAGAAFEAVCRRSSKSSCTIPTLGTTCTLYYYHDLNAQSPDRYAKFYVQNKKLYVQHGSGNNVLYTVQLANNVQSIKFTQHGDAIKMVLFLNDGKKAMKFVNWAIRNAH
ncbi:MAG: hypothetical protein WCZ89_02055 [Phycisphaerae bacterium]